MRFRHECTIGGSITAKTVTLSSGGKIIQGAGGLITCEDAYLDSDDDCGSATARLKVDCDTIDQNCDDGSVYMEFLSPVVILQQTVDPGEACDDYDPGHDVTVGGPVSGGTVKIVSGGNIFQGTGGKITADTCILEADEDIGSSSKRVEAECEEIWLDGGRIHLLIGGAFTLRDANAAKLIDISCLDDVTIDGETLAEIIKIASNARIIQLGGTITADTTTLTADDEIGTSSKRVKVEGEEIWADCPGGGIYLHLGSIFTLRDIKASQAVDLDCDDDATIGGKISGTSVKIVAGGKILQGAGGLIDCNTLVLDNDDDCGSAMVRLKVDCDTIDQNCDDGSVYMEFLSPVVILQQTVDQGEACDDYDPGHDVTVGGPITGGTVTINSGGSIIQGTGGLIDCVDLIIDSKDDCGSSSKRLEVQCNTLHQSCEDGSIFMRFNSPVDILQQTVDPGEECDDSNTSNHDFTIAGPVSGGTVRLNSGGKIIQGAGGLITAGSATFTAAGSIGEVGNRLQVNCNVINGTSGADVLVGTAGNDCIYNLGAGGLIDVQSGGKVTVGTMTAGGSVTLLSTGGVIIVQGALSTAATGNANGGSVSLTASNSSISVTTGNINASGAGSGNGGAITLLAGGNIAVSGPITTKGTGSGHGGNVSLTYGGDCNIMAAITTTGSGSNGNGGNIVLNGAASDPGTGNPIYVWAFALDASGAGSGKGGDIKLSGGSIVLLAGSSLKTNGGSIVLTGNNLSVDATSTCDTGGGIAIIQPHKSGWAIDLGGADSPTKLGVTTGELARIDASSLTIGSGTAGSITVLASVATKSDGVSLVVYTAGSVINAPGGSIKASSLLISAGGDIGSLTNPLVMNCASVTPQTYGGRVYGNIAGSVSITSALTSPLSGNGGDISLTSAGSITVVGDINTKGTGASGNGGNIQLIANGGGSIAITTGKLMADGSGTGNGGNISLTAGGPIMIATANSATGGAGGAGGLGGMIGVITTSPGSAITLQASASLDTSSTKNNGGSITIQSAGDCQLLGALMTQGGGATGTGGAVSITTGGQIFVGNTGNINSSATGTGGNIALSASGPINVLGVIKGGSGSDIDADSGVVSFQSLGDIQVGGAVTTRGGNISGKGGNISITAGNTNVITVSGNLNASGGSGGSGGNILLIAGSSISLVGNSKLTSNNGGDVTLRSDNIALGGTCTVDIGGSGDFAFEPFSMSRLIDLGGPDSATSLGISDAEIDRVKAGTIKIGSSTAGKVTLTAMISSNEPAQICWIISGGEVDGISGGYLSAHSLKVTAAGHIGTLANPLNTGVNYLTIGLASDPSGISEMCVSNTSILTIEGISVSGTGSGGSVRVTAGGTITVVGDISTKGMGASGNGGSIQLIANSGGSILVTTGKMITDGSGTGNGGNISLTAGGPIMIATANAATGGAGGAGGLGGVIGIITTDPGSAVTLQASASFDTSSTKNHGGSITIQSAGDCQLLGVLKTQGGGSLGNGGDSIDHGRRPVVPGQHRKHQCDGYGQRQRRKRLAHC